MPPNFTDEEMDVINFNQNTPRIGTTWYCPNCQEALNFYNTSDPDGAWNCSAFPNCYFSCKDSAVALVAFYSTERHSVATRHDRIKRNHGRIVHLARSSEHKSSTPVKSSNYIDVDIASLRNSIALLQERCRALETYVQKQEKRHEALGFEIE